MSDDDREQWRAPGRTPERRTTIVHLGKRHMISSPNQPDDVACFCPIARNHTETEFNDALVTPTRTRRQ